MSEIKTRLICKSCGATEVVTEKVKIAEFLRDHKVVMMRRIQDTHSEDEG